MKQRLLIYSILMAAIFGIYAASTKTTAQIAGGYSDASVKNKDVTSAARFAVKERSSQTHKNITLVKIVKAEVQVVAGLNYRVCMSVREGRGKIKRVTAVVYRDLKDKKSLSRWKSGGCTDL